MEFSPLSVPLVIKADGREGTALGFFHGPGASDAPEDFQIIYLVSFPGEAAPRRVDQHDVTSHRIGRA